jgi:cation transport ATPase
MFKLRTGISFVNIDLSAWLQAILGTVVVLWPGIGFHQTMFRLVLEMKANMDTLVSMGAGAAVIFSWRQFIR